MKKVILLLSFFLFTEISFGQISGIINDYTEVTAIDVTCNKVTVASSAAFNVGDTVLLIQMQGATVPLTNGATYGDITAINNAGNYEFGEISVIAGNIITLKNTLLKSYTSSGSVQLVSVPQFTNVTITGELTAETWNGTTGGVLVFEATGTVTLSADINVSGKGFRGGAVNPNGGDCLGSSTGTYFYSASSVQGSGKGEGIIKIPTGHESGRGKLVNGGGGGNSHNTGGGGGGNYGAGGRGGDKIGPQCDNAFYPNAYGLGGYGFTTTYYSNANNRIFLGGGGGAGQQNNYANGGPGPPNYWTGGTPGGPGGGIVIIKAATINGNGYSILAKGTLDPAVYRAWGDGAGGGGAGGTVLISSNNFPTTVNIDVSGNKGDDVYDESSRNPGPGGGGGGGLIWVSTATLNSNITPVTNGGIPGILSGAGTCLCNRNAAAGSTGGSLTNLVIPESSTLFPGCTTTPVEITNFSAKTLNQKVKLDWTTASERNNEYFSIERTTDLENFILIGKVKGSNNSNSEVPYFMYDDNPVEGTFYYRLSQTDIDGKSKVLGIVSVKNEAGEKLISKIYPVPFQNEFTIELNTNKFSGAELRVKVYNTLGETIYESIYNVIEKINLSLPDMPVGIYTVTVQSDNKIEIVRILRDN